MSGSCSRFASLSKKLERKFWNARKGIRGEIRRIGGVVLNAGLRLGASTNRGRITEASGGLEDLQEQSSARYTQTVEKERWKKGLNHGFEKRAIGLVNG